MQNEIIIDMGGGRRKYPGSVGIDIVKLEGVDIVADLNKGIPLKDDSVDMLVSFHFLEHINDFIYI